MTTLRDVARHAGVSIGSVSTVLNNTAPVSPALKAKVLKAVEELGYVPDAVARSLKTGRSRTIGLIVPDITNPHFSAVASAIEIACDASGYALLLCNTTDSPAKELRDLHLMRRQRVDGVILVPSGSGEAYVAELKRAATMPVVLIDRTLEGFDADAVVLDNRAASYGIVDYLVRAGHRRIGIVAGPTSMSIAEERLAGYRQALEEHAIDYIEDLVARGAYQPEPDYRATASLLARRPRPTAIVSTSNHTMIGVMKALAELLGAKNAEAFLRSDGIVRRFVATVDNLAREQAPASAWPVQPTGQRFITEGQGEAQTISANNAARYNGFVLLVQSVDPAKAAAVYAKLYPLFQQAYEELGYPGRYFNDRLIAVIDNLLQAPEPKGPVQVRLVEVKGDVPSQRPWVRYEYVDQELEKASAGQKIMVRMGPENERKMKASLRALRQQVATADIAKKKSQ